MNVRQLDQREAGAAADVQAFDPAPQLEVVEEQRAEA
jgi:hypothetical protein